ncbi:MAG: hypothetical protein AB7U43_02280 [Desulfobacter sp.]
MFDHHFFEVCDFEQIPLDTDTYLVDMAYAREYEEMMLKLFDGGEYEAVGYVGYVAAREVTPDTLKLSWYPNISTRFHELSITLPRDQFVTCVCCWEYGEKPRIYVKSDWIEELHLRLNSVFCLVDAINVKEAIRKNTLCRDNLISLRTAIDNLASRYPQVSFISFADSIILKSNWTAGYYKKKVKYTYEPEVFLKIVSELQQIYREHLGLEIYAVLTQGSNEYYEDSLLHISESNNHICLNSLGTPFEQLQSIEKAARQAIRDSVHDGAEIYMDEQFFFSISFNHKFDRHGLAHNPYRSSMMNSVSAYYYSSCQNLIDNLKSVTDVKGE